MSESVISEPESESQQIPISEPEPQSQIQQQQPEQQQATKKPKKHGKLKKLLFEIIEKNNITNYNEIMEKWDSFFVDQPIPKMPSKTTIFNAFQSYKKQNEVKTETEQQTITPESIVIVEDTGVSEEEKKILDELNVIEKDKVVSAIVTGKIKKEHIETVFKIENKILNATLGEDYKLDSETIDMLATIGEQPLNQMFGKYLTDSNSNLYIFIGLVAWAHVPILIRIIKDGKLWKKKKTLP